METQIDQQEQIREQQKASWNKFSPGWGKWDEMTMTFLKPYGEEIINLLKPSGDDVVLDAAAGTGEPGLTIAKMLTGGKVVLTDLSEGMLQVAADKAKQKGITNVETVVSDICNLPFDDNTFDLISCRMGFMFFPDMHAAASEMERVLKPGGKVAISVWGMPENNFWVTSIMGAMKKHIDLPTPPPGAPGMFRCAEPGLMSNIFKQASFVNVSETELSTKIDVGTAENYWAFMTEVAAPIVGALSQADAETIEKIKTDLIASLKEKYPDNKVVFDGSGYIVYGEK